ncbi:YgaB family protein [Bacillus sp. S10(2024)]|uniref:YgaB family protein n=1 Tax=Bacillus sp. S10(2024) TaxID=3162886 RepID=UPI003D1A8CDF
MKLFDELVEEQLRTMDELLKLQVHLEKYQHLEMNQQDAKELHFIRQEIQRTEKALKGLQLKFEQQTAAVIHSFENEKMLSNEETIL